MPKTLILAPHIDDELIGCWSVLSKAEKGDVTVAYFCELTSTRMVEAFGASKGLGFNIYTGNAFEIPPVFFGEFEKIYVPSRQDWHADHKTVNRLYRQHATHFYSVDMANGKLLEDSTNKKTALDYFYPSQSSLWQANAKYYLFEDIAPVDFAVSINLPLSEGCSAVLDLRDHSAIKEDPSFLTWLSVAKTASPEHLTVRLMVDSLFALCKYPVEIKTPNLTIKG